MNLNKFKILGEDEKSYRVGHPNGKSITVEKAGLSKEAHKHIQKLADGGVVDSSPTDESIVQQLAAQPVQDAPPTPEEPGILTKIGAAIDPNSTDAQEVNDFSGQQVKGPAPASVEQPAQAVPQAPAPNPLAQAATSQGQLLSQEEQQAKQYQAGIAGANAPVSQSIDQAQKQLADLQQQQAQREQDYKAKDDAYQAKLADPKNKIDPNRVYKNMDTGSKILAGISMIMGNIGTAFGGPNLAAKVMDDAINRDIDSQKNDQDKSMNLWKMNRQAYGDDTQANLATRNQILSGVQLQLQKAASSTSNLEAQMRANQVVNQIQSEKIQNNRTQGMLAAPAAGATQGAKGLIGTDPVQLVPQFVPAEKQAAALKELSDAQHISENKQQMLDLWDKTWKEQSVLNPSTVGGIMDSPSKKALNALNDPLIHDEAGRVNEFEANDLKGIMPQTGDIKQSTHDTKRAAYEAYITRKAAAPTAKAFGLDPQKFASTAIIDDSAPVQRITKDGRTALFNPSTKQFLGYK